MLPIRRTCHFFLDPQEGWAALKIRYRIRYAGYVTNVAVGHRAEPSKWSTEAERCLKNTSHGDKRTPAAAINRAIQYVEESMERAFAYSEGEERLPSPDELKAKYNEYLQLALGIEETKAQAMLPEDNSTIVAVFDAFVASESVRRSWSERYNANYAPHVCTYLSIQVRTPWTTSVASGWQALSPTSPRSEDSSTLQ